MKQIQHMIKWNSIIIHLLLFVAFINEGSAAKIPDRDIVICGKLSKELSASLKNDELTVHIFTEVYDAADKNWHSIHPLKLMGDSFKVTINAPSPLFYFQIQILPVENLQKVFLVQAGDSLYLNINSKDSFWWQSNNKPLFDCQLELNRENILSKRSFNNDALGSVNYLTCRVDSVIKNFDMVLHRYNKKINAKLLELLRINYQSELYINYLNRLAIPALGVINKDDEHGRNYAIEVIKDFYRKSKAVQDPLIIRNSLYYAKAIYEMEKIWNGIVSKKENLIKPRFDLTYNAINARYSGLLREKVLTILFLQSFRDSDNAIKYLNVTIPIIQDTIYKKKLLSLQLSRYQGNPAYPFKLISDNGQTYALDDFRGKVMICKFWFNGCAGCAALEKKMKPLKEKYRNNPNIVFISINTDRNKSGWEKGLIKGIYNSKQDINLSTLNEHHPMLEFYHYFGFPQLLLIDKFGKIINSSPVPPKDDASLTKLDELIKEFL